MRAKTHCAPSRAPPHGLLFPPPPMPAVPSTRVPPLMPAVPPTRAPPLMPAAPQTATLVERDGSWHHLAITWSAKDDGLTSIYMDGLLSE